MTNSLMIAIYMPMLLITAVTPFFAYIHNKNVNSVKEFILICVNMLIWHTLQICFFSTQNEPLALFLYNIQMPFIALLPVIILIFVLRFYRMEKYLRPAFIAVLCIIPAITSLFAVTNEYHHLYRTAFEFIQTYPVYITYNVRGPWFWIHTGYSYILLVMVILIVIYQIMKLPPVYRLPSYMIILGLLTTIGFNVFKLSYSYGNEIDYTAIGATLALLFLYMAINTNEIPDFVSLSRNEVFEALDDYIFILNMDDTIYDANNAAKKWLDSEMNLEPYGLPFSKITGALIAKGAIITPDEPGSQSCDIYLPNHEQYPSIAYRLRKRYITDAKKRKMGSILYFSDITHMRNILDELEEQSSVDALTGVLNRRAYERKLIEYDRAENYPLSIIIGDINGLKQVNDTYGHIQGDSLLKTISAALIQACGQEAVIARIGGDEFAIILLKTDEAGVNRIIGNILYHLKTASNSLYTPSIALGYAIKTNSSQDMDDLVKLADSNMYCNKKQKQI